MKVLLFTILPLFSLLLEAHAQTQEVRPQAVENDLVTQISSGASLTNSTTTSDFDLTTSTEADSSPFIENSLGLPVMRDQQTITESSQDLSIVTAEIDSTYGKMMQDFAATLDQNTNESIRSNESRQRHPLIEVFIGFIIEIIITLIVLKIAFQLNGFRSKFGQLIPLCVAVALVGAFLSGVFGISLFSPIRIGLTFLVMLVLIRTLTNVHEWATAILIILTARLVSIGIMWLAVTGMIALLGL